MNKVFDNVWYKLLSVILWGILLGATILGNFSPSKTIIVLAFLIIFLDRLDRLLGQE